MKYLIVTIFSLLFSNSVWALSLNDIHATPLVILQAWNQTENLNHSTNSISYLRRGRAGVNGVVGSRIHYNLMLSFDNVGKAAQAELKLWSLYSTLKVFKQNELLNISFGYMLPQLSRESVTNPWTVSTQDKAMSSQYLRQFVTGRKNGISPAICLGGISDFGHTSIRYDVTAMKTLPEIPVFANCIYYLVHVDAGFGKKRLSKYKYLRSANYFGKVDALNVGMGASLQPGVEKSNYSIGNDFSWEKENMHIDGELFWLIRKDGASDFLGKTGFVRAAYRKRFFSCILEPALAWQFYYAPLGQSIFFDGSNTLMDYGVNVWNKSRKLRWSFHYLNYKATGTNNYTAITGHNEISNLIVGLQLTI